MSISQKLGSIITNTVGLWVIVCMVWTVISVTESFMINRSEQASTFKEQCISESGQVRHDSWLFGVDIYCLKLDGNESVFIYKDEHIAFGSTLISRIFFGLFDLGTK